MVKFRLYYDKDKEEVFLNKMVSKGYAMKKFFLGFYSFEQCNPNEYTYRVDLLTGKNFEEKSDYIQLIKESGGEYVQMWGLWAIFRKRGSFELYTDNESKIEFYSRIRKMFILVGLLELGFAIYEWVILASGHLSDVYSILPIIITIITLAIFCEVYKCNKKIKILKEEI